MVTLACTAKVGVIYSQSKAVSLVWLGFWHGMKEILHCCIFTNIARFYLPPSPTQTKSHGLKGYFRGKSGWFTEREEVVMVTRILRDDPGKSTMHNVSLLSTSKGSKVLT
jgi:hypothetical protein